MRAASRKAREPVLIADRKSRRQVQPPVRVLSLATWRKAAVRGQSGRASTKRSSSCSFRGKAAMSLFSPSLQLSPGTRKYFARSPIQCVKRAISAGVVLRCGARAPACRRKRNYEALAFGQTSTIVCKAYDRLENTGIRIVRQLARAKKYDEDASQGTGRDRERLPVQTQPLPPSLLTMPECFTTSRGLDRCSPDEAHQGGHMAFHRGQQNFGSRLWIEPRIACPVTNASISVPHFGAWIFSSSTSVGKACAGASGEWVSIAYRSGRYAVVVSGTA